MNKCAILLTADCVVTQNDKREIIRDGAVAVNQGIIIGLGARADLEKNWQAEKTMNLGRALIMPGLVNAHTHLPMTLLRGIADDLPLMEWLTRHIFPLEALLTPDMLRAGTALACAEMLRTGTIAFNDMYLNEPHVYRTADACGLKGLASESVTRYPSPGYGDPANALDTLRAQAAELKGNPRLRYCIAPHAVYTTTPALLESLAGLAAELDLPMDIHLAETKTETATCLEQHGCRPVELCRRVGILGRNTTAAHCVDLTEAEIALLAETGTVAAHNPKSNLKLASGVAPLPAMLKAGVRMSLGTDGAASNNALNMFSEMSFCALIHKGVHQNPTLVPAQTVLDMATLGGAEALHWPGLGQLAPEGPADLIALDLDSPNLAPMHDPVSHIVYAASGQEVRLTMIDGKILYENGKYHSLDYPALVKEAGEIGAFFRSRK